MNLNASLKTFGRNEGKAVVLQVPDSAKCLEGYDIEIVEYPYGFTTIFLSKQGEDVLSKTFTNYMPNGLKEAFRDIVERLT